MYNIAPTEIELTFKSKVKASERIKISNSKDCADVCRQIIGDSEIVFREHFVMLCLSQANKIIGFYRVSSGGVSGTVVDPKIVFTVALNCPGTTQIILCHNHPSGNLRPSRADEEITQKLIKAGQLLEIRILDHIIVTEEGYYSFSDEGLI